MDNIVKFERPTKNNDSKFGTGKAYCLSCKDEWISVVELPLDYSLECPSCHTNKVTLKYPFVPDIYRECNCDNSLFYITPAGIFCPNCGDFQNFEDEEYLN